MAVMQHVFIVDKIKYFVSFWKHGIKFLISQWAIPLINLSLPTPSLQLFGCHAHQVTYQHSQVNCNCHRIIK